MVSHHAMTTTTNDDKVPLRIETSIFHNLATCASCLKRQIVASGEIAVHNYRMGDVPSRQRDVPFMVGLFCVQCRRKFSIRSLEWLLVDDDAYRCRLMPPGLIDKVDGRKTSDADRWRDAVEATIAMAGWVKREMRKERNRRRRRNRGECGRNDGNGNMGGG